jgi:hypothetical protein
MEVGQVGFVSDKAVSRYNVSKRCNETVNRLNKTRQERFPDLAAEREAYEAAGRAEKKAEERARRKSELETQREREREQQERSYDRIMGVRACVRCVACVAHSRGLIVKPRMPCC